MASVNASTLVGQEVDYVLPVTLTDENGGIIEDLSMAFLLKTLISEVYQLRMLVQNNFLSTGV